MAMGPSHEVHFSVSLILEISSCTSKNYLGIKGLECRLVSTGADLGALAPAPPKNCPTFGASFILPFPGKNSTQLAFTSPKKQYFVARVRASR